MTWDAILPIHAKTLRRHSCGVHLLEAGADIREVQDFLGHRNIQNTLVYAQTTDKIRQRTDDLAELSPEIVKV